MRDKHGMVWMPGGVGGYEKVDANVLDEQLAALSSRAKRAERVRKVNARMRDAIRDFGGVIYETYAVDPHGGGYVRACDTCYRVGCLDPAHRGEPPAIDVEAR